MSGLVELKDLKAGHYDFQIAKQHWNKGDKSTGFLHNDKTGEYISNEYIQSIGHDCMIYVKDCGPISVDINKSQDKQNHIIKLR